MKKLITVATVAALSASILCGCGKHTTTNFADRLPLIPDAQNDMIGTESNDDRQQNNEMPRDIQITIDGESVDEFLDKISYRPPFSGVRRRFDRDRSGTYTVEYIHVPYGIDRDETLDYSITLNDDNTFTMSVTSEGVHSEHNGHWYARRDSITMFYDEEIEQPAHNVYVSDCMYGELLSEGKIMIYDNCHTIVLSRTQDEAELYAK